MRFKKAYFLLNWFIGGTEVLCTPAAAVFCPALSVLCSGRLGPSGER